MQNKRSFLKKIGIVLGLGTFICTGGIAFYHYARPQTVILDFDEQRDTPFILESFKRDWYWLVEGFDYSPEYMLHHRASSKNPQTIGNLTIKTAYQEGKPVGFVIYFKKNFYLGDLRFIDVNPEFRSKGWAYKLLDYAVKDLIKQGCIRVKLVTREVNYAARRLYTRYGFEETRQQDGFAYFEYSAP